MSSAARPSSPSSPRPWSAPPLGAVPPAPGYFRRVREICDRHGVLLILDEVMCGMGRTGTLHACEQEGIAPDLMAIAKGLGGGYQPIGALLVQREDLRHHRDGHRASSSTATPISAIRSPAPRRSPCSRSSARDDLLDERARRRARSCAPAAASASAIIPCRRHPRPRPVPGDRAGRRPRHQGAVRPGAASCTRAIKREAMARGLMVYPMGGTIDGARGDHVLLAPPFIISDDELDRSSSGWGRPSMPPLRHQGRPV